jgi:Transposase.
VTSDETWDHHNDPENDYQSMVYCYKGSPVSKKFKTKVSVGKDMVTIFWNSDFWLKVGIVN